MEIKKILENKKEENVSIKGWVISNRGNEKIRFITINDGTTFDSVQIVVKEQAKEMDVVRVGSSVLIEGDVKLTPDAKQPLEILASNIVLLKNADEDFPLQKQGMAMETLREIPHLRHRTNTFRAVMRVRSTLALKIHEFFSKENYLWMASPIITGNDGEGAGEAFIVDDETSDQFFGSKATLSVTGQLHAESYSNGFGKVYTFGPTFRAENSHTQRHASEFWMLEPEVAFADLKDIIAVSSDLVKYAISETIKALEPEFKFLNHKSEDKLLPKLNNVISKEIKIMDYADVIKELEKVKDIFENKNIEFGMDLNTEHEKYIAEKHVDGPVAVINYPKDIKAFYMHLNDDNKTVAAFDMLVPGIGELIGGSQRETNIDKITSRVNEMGIDQEDLQWYLDLRRFGQSMSSGFGLGFERLVMYVTGVENIRDSIPYPRTPKNMKM